MKQGEPVDVTAKSGKKKKTITITPSSQNKELVFDLKKKATQKWTPKDKKPQDKPEGPAKKPEGSKKPDKGSGGLKIPELFKDN